MSKVPREINHGPALISKGLCEKLKANKNANWLPGEEILYHYNQTKNILSSNEVQDCVFITNKRIVKLESNKIKSEANRADIVAVYHKDNGKLKYDKLFYTLRDGQVTEMGIWSTAVARFYCSLLDPSTIKTYISKDRIPPQIHFGAAIESKNIKKHLMQHDRLQLTPTETILAHFLNTLDLIVKDETENCIILTTERIVKMENKRIVEQIPIRQVIQAMHQKNNTVRYDKLIARLITGENREIGILMNTVTEFFTQVLMRYIKNRSVRLTQLPTRQSEAWNANFHDDFTYFIVWPYNPNLVLDIRQFSTDNVLPVSNEPNVPPKIVHQQSTQPPDTNEQLSIARLGGDKQIFIVLSHRDGSLSQKWTKTADDNFVSCLDYKVSVDNTGKPITLRSNYGADDEKASNSTTSMKFVLTRRRSSLSLRTDRPNAQFCPLWFTDTKIKETKDERLKAEKSEMYLTIENNCCGDDECEKHHVHAGNLCVLMPPRGKNSPLQKWSIKTEFEVFMDELVSPVIQSMNKFVKMHLKNVSSNEADDLPFTFIKNVTYDCIINADSQFSIWRPVAGEGNIIFGDFVRAGYEIPEFTTPMQVVKDHGDAFAKPTTYNFVAKQSFGPYDFYVWLPEAKEPYEALGHVVTLTPDMPVIPSLRCVHRRYLRRIEANNNKNDIADLDGIKELFLRQVFAGTIHGGDKDAFDDDDDDAKEKEAKAKEKEKEKDSKSKDKNKREGSTVTSSTHSTNSKTARVFSLWSVVGVQTLLYNDSHNIPTNGDQFCFILGRQKLKLKLKNIAEKGLKQLTQCITVLNSLVDKVREQDKMAEMKKSGADDGAAQNEQKEKELSYDQCFELLNAIDDFLKSVQSLSLGKAIPVKKRKSVHQEDLHKMNKEEKENEKKNEEKNGKKEKETKQEEKKEKEKEMEKEKKEKSEKEKDEEEELDLDVAEDEDEEEDGKEKLKNEQNMDLYKLFEDEFKGYKEQFVKQLTELEECKKFIKRYIYHDVCSGYPSPVTLEVISGSVEKINSVWDLLESLPEADWPEIVSWGFKFEDLKNDERIIEAFKLMTANPPEQYETKMGRIILQDSLKLVDNRFDSLLRDLTSNAMTRSRARSVTTGEPSAPPSLSVSTSKSSSSNNNEAIVPISENDEDKILKSLKIDMDTKTPSSSSNSSSSSSKNRFDFELYCNHLKELLDDLDEIHSICEHEEIAAHFTLGYHQNVLNYLNKLPRGMNVNEVTKCLQFTQKYKEKIIGFLDGSSKKQKRQIKADINSQINKLMEIYVDTTKSKLVSWITVVLTNEQNASCEKDDKGKYFTPGPTDLFTNINNSMQYALEYHQLMDSMVISLGMMFSQLVAYYMMCMHRFISQTKFEPEEGAKGDSYSLQVGKMKKNYYYFIAQINNAKLYEDNLDQLHKTIEKRVKGEKKKEKEKKKPSKKDEDEDDDEDEDADEDDEDNDALEILSNLFDDRRDEFEDLADKCAQALGRQIVCNLNPFLNKLFSPDWLNKTNDVMKSVLEELDTYFNTFFEGVSKSNYMTILVQTALHGLIVEYIRTFAARCKSISDPDAAFRMINSDYNQLRDFFEGTETVSKEVIKKELENLQLLEEIYNIKNDEDFWSVIVKRVKERLTNPSELNAGAVMQSVLNIINISRETRKEIMAEFGNFKDNLTLSPTQNSEIEYHLEIKCINGKNLVSMDRNGFSDPYLLVKLCTLPPMDKLGLESKDSKTGKEKENKDNKTKEKEKDKAKIAAAEKQRDIQEKEKAIVLIEKRTKTIDKTLNPEWNETFYFPPKFFKDVHYILFECWDHDILETNDFMGECWVTFEEVERCIVLQRQKASNPEKKQCTMELTLDAGFRHKVTGNKQITGAIKVEFTYYTQLKDSPVGGGGESKSVKASPSSKEPKQDKRPTQLTPEASPTHHDVGVFVSNISKTYEAKIQEKRKKEEETKKEANKEEANKPTKEEQKPKTNNCPVQ